MFLPFFLEAQVKEIGTPFIKNYPRKITQAGQQNWMIDQDSAGIMYFGNNDGLLEFNGHDWDIKPLPNQSVVRSLKVVQDKVFVAGFNELGYFDRDYTGLLKYNSLLQLIPEAYRDFGDIWKIHIVDEDIVFQSYEFIFYFNGKSFNRIIKAPVLFHFSFFIGGELYVNDIENGLYRIAPERLVSVPGLETLKGKEIWGMEILGTGILIATTDEGLFYYKDNILKRWETEANEFLKKNQVYSSIRLSKDKLAFGTIQNGLLICDNDGRVLKTIDLKNGLQNNTILSLKLDSFSNLWLGLDNGIDYLNINSPFSHSNGLSAGYASASIDGKLYLGTNQGVFVKAWNALDGKESFADFSIIEETRGQVWSLNVLDDKLFCGHNKGFFKIENGQAKLICEKAGGWMLSQVPSNKNIMIGGTYTGFVLFQKIDNKWEFIQDISGFNESGRMFIWKNDSTIWMSHGLKGIYRLKFSNDYKRIEQAELFGEHRGLPSDINLELSFWDKQIVVTSPSGIYSFDEKEQSFYKDTVKTEMFEGKFPLKIIEDKYQNIWFFTANDLGVLRKQEDGSFNAIITPFATISNTYINGFQHLNIFDTENVIIGSDIGFIHYDPSFSKKYDYSFQTYISQVGFLKKDSLLQNINIIHSDISLSTFKNNENHFVFNFSASDFENEDNLVFSAYLEGYDDDWDMWSAKRTREYTNLDEGEYIFRVRAKNGFQTISKEASYSFSILPPWYKTWWAYLIYFALFILSFYLAVYYVKRQANLLKRKEKAEQIRLRRQNENKMLSEKLQAEKELIRLKNEQLKKEMIAKDKELANSTLQMIQKNKLLNRLKQELDKLNSETTDALVKNQNQALIRRINREIEDKNQWRVFEEHFEAVHEDFLKRLRNQYPQLTPKERKLAAYLRLNISTKEIALLMNISARGVEVARYRLRKKMELSREVNLLDFILKF